MKKEEIKEQQEETTAANTQSVTPVSDTPQFPVILRAKSREELDTQFQQLKVKHDGHTLTAGAVARNSDDGTYILRVDII